MKEIKGIVLESYKEVEFLLGEVNETVNDWGMLGMYFEEEKNMKMVYFRGILFGYYHPDIIYFYTKKIKSFEG